MPKLVCQTPLSKTPPMVGSEKRQKSQNCLLQSLKRTKSAPAGTAAAAAVATAAVAAAVAAAKATA